MTTKKSRFVQLGWKILEAKFYYYVLDDSPYTDYEYDRMEKEYESLARELGEEPTATNMVGFKEDSPSARLVRRKIMESGS